MRKGGGAPLPPNTEECETADDGGDNDCFDGDGFAVARARANL